jgi:hypothetical protein
MVTTGMLAQGPGALPHVPLKERGMELETTLPVLPPVLPY